MLHMIKIRFPNYKGPVILIATKTAEGAEMYSYKGQVLTCGAGAVIMEETGQVTTSIDLLVNGAKRLVAKFSQRGASGSTR